MKNLLFVFLLFGFTINIFAQGIFINEVMANNQSFMEDPDGAGEYDEWFEIFNSNDQTPVTLDGMFLSNSSSNLTMWTIPDSTILQGNDFLIFTADNQENQGKYHTNFLLNSNGGKIFLTDTDGVTIIDSITYFAQDPDVSEGRLPDGADNWQITPQPTPGYPNGGDDPYLDQIYSATSTDGINWTTEDRLIIDHASVPGVVYFQGKIYLYYVNFQDPENDKLSVAISSDNGLSFDYFDVIISNPVNSPHPVDPNPIIDNGQIRLTYLGNLDEPEPGKIVTAHSDDGIHFTEDSVLINGDYYDPDLFFDSTNSEWVLFLGQNQNIIKATSATSTGAFSLDNNFSWDHGAVSSTHLIEGHHYTYFVGEQAISVTEYSNGGLDFPPIAEGIIDFNGRLNADPTVANLSRGDYIMYFKTKAENEPLPIILSSFTATDLIDGIKLHWETTSEINNAGWNLYRAEDLNKFVKINNDLIIGAGNSTEINQYEYYDIFNFENNKQYFYKLESVAYDGSSFFCKMINIYYDYDPNDNQPDISEQIIIKAFPNPISDKTVFYLPFDTSNSIKVKIFNLKGELIKTLRNNSNAILWDTTDNYGKKVSSGIYLYKIIIDDQTRMVNKILIIK